MNTPERNSFLIDRLDQIQALIVPTRQEIVDALEVIGPASVVAIAEVLGRAPDSLYHHIRILLKVGLVRKVETRIRGRNREAVYDLPGRPLILVYDLENHSRKNALNSLIKGMTRIASRDFERAVDQGSAEVDGPRRNLRGARLVGRLNCSHLEEINRLYQQIASIFSTAQSGVDEGDLHAVTFMIAPLERNY